MKIAGSKGGDKFTPFLPLVQSGGFNFFLIKAGKVVYKRAFGMANVELDVQMRPEMVFNIGSITKQFTAIASGSCAVSKCGPSPIVPARIRDAYDSFARMKLGVFGKVDAHIFIQDRGKGCALLFSSR